MTNLRDKIAEVLDEYSVHVDEGRSLDYVADAILALPETAGWTALEEVSEALVNAEERIEELEAKLAEVEAARDNAGWTALEGATEALVNAESKLAEVMDSLQDVSTDFNDAHREKVALEAMLPRAYRAGVDAVVRVVEIHRDQCGLDQNGCLYVSEAEQIFASATAHEIAGDVFTLPTPTSAELIEQLKETE